jgi:hypothetical protein
LEIFKKPVGKKGQVDTYLKLKCNVDGYEWVSRLGDLTRGHGCVFCGKRSAQKIRRTPKNNSIRNIRPDLVKHLKFEEDADTFTILTRRKTWFICENCGNEKLMNVGNFVRFGIRCNICSDGISTPEKFCINLLKELNIEFITQYSNVWSNTKKYDFYLPSLNMIIETHIRILSYKFYI